MEKSKEQAQKTKIALALFLFCFSFLLFLNSIGNNFVFDDRIVVEKNELIKDPSRIPQIFSTPYHFGYKGSDTGLYRPVTIFSFALNYYISGFSRYAYHFVNIFLHSLISVLIFLFLLKIDGRMSLAFASSLFFASHPIHTEVVSNLAGRAELLYSLFFIAALMLYIKSKVLSGRRKILVFSLSMLAFFVSLLSKESAIIFPVVVIFYDLLFYKGGSQERTEKKFNIQASLLFGGVAVIYLVIRFFVLGSFTGAAEILPVDNPLTTGGFYERFLGATKVFGKYLWLLIFPLRLSADYSFNQIKIPQSIFELSVVIPFIIFAISIFAFIRALKRSRALAFVIAFFCITYSIVSNYFIMIGTIMGERLMYLPSLSYCILLSLLLIYETKPDKPRKKGIEKAAHPAQKVFKTYQIAILCVIALLYSVRTLTRNLDWKDEHSIFSSAEKVSPESVKVLNNLGVVLNKMKRYDDAIERFKKALSIYPEHMNARQNLAQSYLSVGDTKAAELEIGYLLTRHDNFAPGYFTYAEVLRREGKLSQAIAAIKKAIEIDPNFPEAQDLLGKILLESGDFAGAEKALKETLEKDPSSVIYHNDLGLLYTAQNRFPEAVAEFRLAVDLDPNNASIMSNLGIAYRGMTKYEDAVQCFIRALRSSPDNSSIQYNLGLAYMDQQKHELAIGEFKKILEREPKNHEALTRLGGSLVSLAKYDEAIDVLSRAIQANPQFEAAYSLRAKAYFISGKYEVSLNDYSKVLSLNPLSVAAWNNRGTIYAMQGKDALARTDWEEALKLAPDQKEIRLNLEKLKKKQR